MACSTANGFVVVTQMYPQQGDTAAPVICTIPQASSVLGKFLKGEPKALGTVQIIIGLMYILLGIVMTVYADSIGVFSGIVFWGAFIYISSGALTVAANNKLYKCLIPACNMASSTASGFVVVTQVCPQQSGTAAPAFCTIPQASPVLGKFLKGELKALGTVQIMIGVLVILLGIVMAIDATSICVYSGIVFWGSLIYISSGALTVAANNKLNKCLVNGALGMNIFSIITAGIAIIIFTLDFVFERRFYYCSYSDSYDVCRRLGYMLQAKSHGMKGVLLVFSILEIIVSAYVTAFACRAVCDCSSQQVVYMAPTSSQVTSENLLIPTPHTYETAVLGQNVMGSMQTEKPPEYVETLP